jgi:hypothetical protein
MKRIFCWLTIAFLTFWVGVASVRILSTFDHTQTISHCPSVSVSQVAQNSPTPVQSPKESEDPLEAAFIDGDKLSHAGYDIERRSDADGRQSSAIIKRNGRTIVRLNNGGLGNESTRIGLFPFLGGENRQLAILQYTGGAHCCWIYKIYDFTPRLRLIFDDENYGIDHIGYELHPIDFDGDGMYELTRSIMAFDYFHMSHATSVFPTAVFSYDPSARVFKPNNRRFPSVILSHVPEDMRALEASRANVSVEDLGAREKYLSAVLQVMLNRIYAGQKEAGWDFFEAEYELSNKREIRADIQQALRGDPIYRSIYANGK